MTPTRTWKPPSAARPLPGHGGRFVIAGGLTLADQQRDYFSGVLREHFPDLLPLYEKMYPHPTASYGGIRSGDPHAIGRRIRELCGQYGISDPPDGVPRPIIPGDKRAHLRQVDRGGASPQRPVLLAIVWSWTTPRVSACGRIVRRRERSKTWSRMWGWSTARWGRPGRRFGGDRECGAKARSSD